MALVVRADLHCDGSSRAVFVPSPKPLPPPERRVGYDTEDLCSGHSYAAWAAPLYKGEYFWKRAPATNTNSSIISTAPGHPPKAASACPLATALCNGEPVAKQSRPANAPCRSIASVLFPSSVSGVLPPPSC